MDLLVNCAFVLVLFLAGVFLLCWLFGVYVWFANVIAGSRLYNRIKKVQSPVRFIFFIYRTKGSYIPVGDTYVSANYMLRILFSFGRKDLVVSWLNIFMDIKALRALNDSFINKQLDKIISRTSLFFKAFILMALSISLAFVISYVVAPNGFS